MPPVGGEIFSALAQAAHWWLQGCHRTQAGTAVQPLCVLRAARPTSCPKCPAAPPGKGNERNAI